MIRKEIDAATELDVRELLWPELFSVEIDALVGELFDFGSIRPKRTDRDYGGGRGRRSASYHAAYTTDHLSLILKPDVIVELGMNADQISKIRKLTDEMTGSYGDQKVRSIKASSKKDRLRRNEVLSKWRMDAMDRLAEELSDEQSERYQQLVFQFLLRFDNAVLARRISAELSGEEIDEAELRKTQYVMRKQNVSHYAEIVIRYRQAIDLLELLVEKRKATLSSGSLCWLILLKTG